MEENDNFVDIIDECIKILDENVDSLNNLEYELESEKEDVVVTNMTKNDLIDMAHEVSDLSKIKKAESLFVKRLLDQI